MTTPAMYLRVPRRLHPWPLLIRAGLLASVPLAISPLWPAGETKNTAGAGREASKEAARDATGKAPSVYQTAVAPFFAKNCFDCHGGEKRKAGIGLDNLGPNPVVLENRKLWDKVLGVLRARKMPPKARPQPSAAEVEMVLRWINEELASFDCTGPPDPGRVTIRRLNRSEYNNTVRDLLALDFKPADDFPADDVGYGFDNIGDVLSLPPLLLEKYLGAAGAIVEKAIVAEPRTLPRVRKHDDSFLKSTGSSGPSGKWKHVLDPGGNTRAKEEIAEAAEYILKARVFQQGAGAAGVKMALLLDDKELGTFDVKATEASPRVFEARARLEPGTRRVQVAFREVPGKVAAKTAPPEKGAEKKPAKKGAAPKSPPKKTPKLVVESITFEGPLDAKPKPLPESHRGVFVCGCADVPGGHVGPDAEQLVCARKVIEHVARRAFRRPAARTEVDRLVKLTQSAMKGGECLERAIQPALQAILASPHFIFRVEEDRGAPGSVAPIGGYELASRLSYFLWSSMPDDELFALAEAGTLGRPEVLDAQVRRMLKDRKAAALVRNFAGQWLQIRNLENVAPDKKRFPEFDDKLRADMERETEMFFESILLENRSVLEFIDADYAFLNQRLAKHYGIAGVEGESFRKVQLASRERGGVLTQASVLTITSNPTRTSPVKRGKWILEQILGSPPPPPPPGVDDLKEDEQAVLNGSLRQRMEQHRKREDCASCHTRMDTLGFGFENFGPTGAWREKDGNFPVDSSGTMPAGQTFNGPAELKTILMADKDEFVKTLAEKMLTFALGRGLEYYDQCAVEKAAKAVIQDGYRFQAMVVQIVQSAPFLLRKRPESSKTGS